MRSKAPAPPLRLMRAFTPFELPGHGGVGGPRAWGVMCTSAGRNTFMKMPHFSARGGSQSARLDQPWQVVPSLSLV